MEIECQIEICLFSRFNLYFLSLAKQIAIRKEREGGGLTGDARSWSCHTARRSRPLYGISFVGSFYTLANWAINTLTSIRPSYNPPMHINALRFSS